MSGVVGWATHVEAVARLCASYDAIPAAPTGAYCRSMANNYNHLLKPPVIAVKDGQARVIVRRETEDDLRILAGVYREAAIEWKKRAGVHSVYAMMNKRNAETIRAVLDGP